MKTVELLEYNGEWYIQENRGDLGISIYSHEPSLINKRYNIKPEIKQWLNDNNILYTIVDDDRYKHTDLGHLFTNIIEYIFLKDKKDFLLFKLRWG
jgi:hypothetical protein